MLRVLVDPTEHVCQSCGKSFMKKQHVSRQPVKYCSAACRDVGKRVKKNPTCRRCGKTMGIGEGWHKNKHGKAVYRRNACDACLVVEKAEAIDNQRKSEEIKSAREKRRNSVIPCPECGESMKGTLKQCSPKCRHRAMMRDPGKHLSMVMRTSVRQCLKGEKAYRRTFDLVGYSVAELMSHIEKQFRGGMSWENYGSAWHIDHIIPLRAFNFEKPEDPDFLRAWGLKNLRPLWAKENIKKSGKLSKPFQPSLAIGDAGAYESDPRYRRRGPARRRGGEDAEVCANGHQQWVSA